MDLCTSSGIAGWVWDSDEPARHFDVEIMVGPKSVATISAQGYRGDLKTAGIGDGTYMFNYVPPAPLDVETQKITVNVIGADLQIRPFLPSCALTVRPEVISQGQSAVLSWTSRHTTRATIDNQIGHVTNPRDSITVAPARTTTYIGTAHGPGGSSYCQATVFVQDPANSALVNELWPISPEHLRVRTAGTSDADWWDSTGARTVNEWSRALNCVNRDFREFDTIVDFGCGTGRALRHLALRLTDKQCLIGLDVDAEQTDWVRDNYPKVTALALNEMPPSPLPANSANLIVANSVFTHLPEAVGHAWFAELERILAPGGILIATFHGSRAIAHMQNHLHAIKQTAELDRFRQNIAERGFHYIAGKNSAAEEPLPDYYGSTFHDIGYIVREWTGSCTILAWLPAFATDYQDTMVLKRN